MVLKCFFQQNATTCPSCSSPSVWNEGILDRFASVSSASPFRVHPQSPLKVSGCIDPIARTNPSLEGGLPPHSRNPCWFLPFYQYCRFQAFHSIFHQLVKVPSQWYMSEFNVIDGLSPCNSWWGWGTGVLKWHLPSSHLWSHWSHWRSENIGTIRLKRTDVWQHGGIEGFVSILDGYLGPLSIVRFKVHENFQNGLWPVGAIGQQPEVRQRFLRCSRLPFHFGELVTCAWHVQQLISMK